jgi:hypothetical protein
MAAIKTRSEAKAKHWGKHLKHWKSSHLTQDQYCAEHELNKHTFTYWKKKFSKKPEQFSLVPVTITPDEASLPKNTSSGLTLNCSDRYCIELSVDFHAPTLKRLVEVLEGR